jgi:hypothetical protein
VMVWIVPGISSFWLVPPSFAWSGGAISWY